jgi:hypothetical protein
VGVGAHVCALGPEGACVHAAVGERTVAPVFRAFGRRRAFASASEGITEAKNRTSLLCLFCTIDPEGQRRDGAV